MQFKLTQTNELADTEQAKIENWLHQQIGPAYDALQADPSRALSVAQVRARLAAEREKCVCARSPDNPGG